MLAAHASDQPIAFARHARQLAVSSGMYPRGSMGVTDAHRNSSTQLFDEDPFFMITREEDVDRLVLRLGDSRIVR